MQSRITVFLVDDSMAEVPGNPVTSEKASEVFVGSRHAHITEDLGRARRGFSRKFGVWRAQARHRGIRRQQNRYTVRPETQGGFRFTARVCHEILSFCTFPQPRLPSSARIRRQGGWRRLTERQSEPSIGHNAPGPARTSQRPPCCTSHRCLHQSSA